MYYNVVIYFNNNVVVTFEYIFSLQVNELQSLLYTAKC